MHNMYLRCYIFNRMMINDSLKFIVFVFKTYNEDFCFILFNESETSI